MKELKDKIKVLISEEELEKRVSELADKLNKDYAGETVTLISILKGSIIFAVDLSKKLTMDVEFDFMDISSYGSEMTSSGIIKVNLDLEQQITGKNIVLVEDIIDSGKTLSYIKKHLLNQEPKDFKICTLLDKVDKKEIPTSIADYTGFEIPDKFVVGYGLDYDQKFRNLPYIGYLEPEDVDAFLNRR